MSSPTWKGLANKSGPFHILYNPAEFSVIGYSQCRSEKISLRDTSAFLSLKRKLNQTRSLVCLAVNYIERRTRQRDNDALILNVNVRREGRGHPLILCAGDRAER
jgi:hypothetical protein